MNVMYVLAYVHTHICNNIILHLKVSLLPFVVGSVIGYDCFLKASEQYLRRAASPL